jgi:hypothetical protein
MKPFSDAVHPACQPPRKCRRLHAKCACTPPRSEPTPRRSSLEPSRVTQGAAPFPRSKLPASMNPRKVRARPGARPALEVALPVSQARWATDHRRPRPFPWKTPAGMVVFHGNCSFRAETSWITLSYSLEFLPNTVGFSAKELTHSRISSGAGRAWPRSLTEEATPDSPGSHRNAAALTFVRHRQDLPGHPFSGESPRPLPAAASGLGIDACGERPERLFNGPKLPPAHPGRLPHVSRRHGGGSLRNPGFGASDRSRTGCPRGNNLTPRCAGRRSSWGAPRVGRR